MFLKQHIYIYIYTYRAPVNNNCVLNILFGLRRLTMHIDSDLSVYLKYIMLLTFTTATLIITKYQNAKELNI